jgi:benzoyl-CoA reductase/2-hydroxyglutaryl-CoA dehydratase subunit BcrC/BadD/HgdB
MGEQPAVDYRPLWRELGLDLDAHDQLLCAIPTLYADAYLSQEGRPDGMEYFDFVLTQIHGLRIKEIDDFRKAGGKVVGTFCLYVPEEIVRAHGGLCIGLCSGAEFAYDKVEQVLPRNTCALIKSFMGFKLGKVCPYIESADLVIGETTCDGKKKAYELLGELHDVWVMELPHMKRERDRAFWRAEIGELVGRMEELTGTAMTAETLRRSVREVNDKRRALQRIAEARKADPVPISGRDALLAVQVAFYDDVGRFTGSVNAVADELEERVARGVGVAPKGAPRVLLTGTPTAIPNWKIHDIVEKAGGVVVQEETCTGARYYMDLVDEEAESADEMLDAIAEKYLDVNCACFTPNEGRIEDVLRYAREWQADGILHCSLEFCGPYQIEATRVREAAKDAGIPALTVDTDYSTEDVAQLSTRVEAFLEMLR